MSATINRKSGNIDRACSSEKTEVVAGTNLSLNEAQSIRNIEGNYTSGLSDNNQNL
jgi:hypothetical protein